jgi:hypothetical protein
MYKSPRLYLTATRLLRWFVKHLWVLGVWFPLLHSDLCAKRRVPGLPDNLIHDFYAVHLLVSTITVSVVRSSAFKSSIHLPLPTHCLISFLATLSHLHPHTRHLKAPRLRPTQHRHVSYYRRIHIFLPVSVLLRKPTETHPVCVLANVLACAGFVVPLTQRQPTPSRQQCTQSYLQCETKSDRSSHLYMLDKACIELGRRMCWS